MSGVGEVGCNNCLGSWQSIITLNGIGTMRIVMFDLIWTHPSGLDLLLAFVHVLIMNCTYMTNHYRMPLLEIVGVTFIDMTFYVCFAYLHAERVENYVWALGVLRSIISDGILAGVIATDK